jgi:hypothetical protein
MNNTIFKRFTNICEKIILNFCIFYNAYLCTFFGAGTFSKFGLFILCFIIECFISTYVYDKLSHGEYTKISNELTNNVLLGKDYYKSCDKLKNICDNYRQIELIIFGIICCVLYWCVNYEW